MAHINNRSFIQERLAKFKGTATVNLTTSQSGSTAHFSTVLSVSLQYNGETRTLESQSDHSYSTKKMSEQSAAGLMLSLADFDFYINHLNWNIAKPASQSSQQSFVNPKGVLLEKISKMVCRPMINFDTTSQAPFTSTITLQPVGVSVPIIVSSDHCSSKKEAEQQASERMLNDAFFSRIDSRGELPPSAVETDGSQDSFAAVTTRASSTSPAPGSGNFKGKLLEKLAQSGGRVKFDCSACSGGFRSVAVAVHVKTTSQFESSSDNAYSSKIAADHSAARVMLHDPQFRVWLTGSAQIDSRQVLDTPGGSPWPLSSSSSTASLSVSSLSSTAPHVNAKGLLLEKSVKMLPKPVLNYQTTRSAPFICTLTATTSASGANAPSTTITTTSIACSTKKAAEHDASMSMLGHPQFLSMGNSTGTNSDTTVKCAKCRGVIGHIADFCFYTKSETEVQFIVKPEVIKQIIDKSLSIPGAASLPLITFAANFTHAVELSQKVAVMCGHCRACIGAHLSFGPDGAMLTAFKNTDVCLKGAIFPSSRSWRLVASELAFSDVEQRTPQNYFGVEETYSVRPTLDLTAVVHPTLVEKLGVDSPHYQYSDLLDAACGKKPRPEQVEALHLALQHHTIVVFPTGFGKTLVASMLMHRYRRLNPAKLVLMVEERVPLVEQQCKALERDTGMKVCPLYGENSSSRSVKKLLDGEFDAAVITAGALCNYLSQDQLRICDFSAIVFDESHHATKSHQYKLVLEMVARYPVYLQPRVVGLTASPLKGKTEGTAQVELDLIRETFLDADVYRPKIGTDIHDLHRHTVKMSPQQRAMQRKVIYELQPLVQKLSSHFAVTRPSLYAQLIGENPIQLHAHSNKYDWGRVTQLSAESYFANGTDPMHIVQMAANMRDMVAALEHNYLLGPSFVTLYGGTVEEVIIADTLSEHPLKSGVSPQLRSLCEILAAQGAESCTLVFVETRYIAKVVHAYIDAKFPILKSQRMVGQSGEDGMRWGGEEGQREILKDFHSKDCRLIVCTSVLEEGLDVKGCNLVIRLGGTPSLIRLVQSKGRARDENGELRLILTREEEDHLRRLLEQESMLDRVLEEFAATTL